MLVPRYGLTVDGVLVDDANLLMFDPALDGFVNPPGGATADDFADARSISRAVAEQIIEARSSKVWTEASFAHRPKRDPSRPFKVVIVDQFQGHGEDGYDTEGFFPTLEEAIAVAREITEDAIRDAGSLEKWFGIGDAGLVYAEGKLVWDGVEEYNPSKRK